MVAPPWGTLASIERASGHAFYQESPHTQQDPDPLYEFVRDDVPDGETTKPADYKSNDVIVDNAVGCHAAQAFYWRRQYAVSWDGAVYHLCGGETEPVWTDADTSS